MLSRGWCLALDGCIWVGVQAAKLFLSGVLCQPWKDGAFPVFSLTVVLISGTVLTALKIHGWLTM